MDDQRLTRIEDKLDKLSEAVVSLVNRLNLLFSKQNALSEKQ